MAMIAKKPDDRPASAAAVARAATALRRGDVAAAAAAVPAIATGAAAGDDVTQLLGAGLATDEATRLLPATTTAPTVAEPEKRKRSPWTWPLIALIALLLIVLGGTVWALFANQGGGPAPTSSTPSPTRTTPTPTPTPTTANVVSSDYEGLDCDAASAKLDALGMGAKCTAGDPAPDKDSVGKIYRVNPTGNLDKGTVVELTYFADQVAMPQPATPTLSAATVEPNGTLTVSWTAYRCPSGTGSVSAYSLTATNGLFSNGQSTMDFDPNTRSTTITAGATDGQTLIVTYTADCSGGSGGEQRTSGASDEATAQITAAGGDDGGDSGGEGDGGGGGETNP
jgi:serine/threonine-protein kinase